MQNREHQVSRSYCCICRAKREERGEKKSTKKNKWRSSPCRGVVVLAKTKQNIGELSFITNGAQKSVPRSKILNDGLGHVLENMANV